MQKADNGWERKGIFPGLAMEPGADAGPLGRQHRAAATWAVLAGGAAGCSQPGSGAEQQQLPPLFYSSSARAVLEGHSECRGLTGGLAAPGCALQYRG